MIYKILDRWLQHNLYIRFIQKQYGFPGWEIEIFIKNKLLVPLIALIGLIALLYMGCSISKTEGTNNNLIETEKENKNGYKDVIDGKTTQV